MPWAQGVGGCSAPSQQCPQLGAGMSSVPHPPTPRLHLCGALRASPRLSVLVSASRVGKLRHRVGREPGKTCAVLLSASVVGNGTKPAVPQALLPLGACGEEGLPGWGRKGAGGSRSRSPAPRVSLSPGYSVKCEYTAHKEGVLKEEMLLASEAGEGACVKVVVQARVMGKGLPALAGSGAGASRSSLGFGAAIPPRHGW